MCKKSEWEEGGGVKWEEVGGEREGGGEGVGGG